MNKYKQIQNRYRALGLDKQSYKVYKKEHVMAIFGLDIDEDIEGLDILNNEEKEFVIKKGVYGLLNSGGLENRDRFIVIKVEKVEDRFKLYTLEGYSWLYRDGYVG